MFTRNWYKAMAALVFGGEDEDTFVSLDGKSTQFIRGYGYSVQIGGNYNDYRNPAMMVLRNNTAGYGGVVIGTGTQPPTIDDYCLSGDLISSYTSSASFSDEYDENGAYGTTLFTITNTGTKAFTIGEIGLISGLNGSGSSYKALLERTVLETPITIEPGGVGQITYTLRMNYPTA